MKPEMSNESLGKVYLSDLFNWKGRASRTEFWWYSVMLLIVLISYVSVGVLLGMIALASPVLEETAIDFGSLYIIAMMVIVAPAVLCMFIRRLHDIGMSGWWLLFMIVGYLPFIALIFMSCWPGQSKENKWGSPPKKVKRRFVCQWKEKKFK